MRKLFVALLILSVMGGAFAQEWSVGSTVEVSGTIDLDAKTAYGQGYNYYWGQDSFGTVGINYANGAFSGGISLNTNNDPLVLSAAVDADNFKFAAETDFVGVMAGDIDSIRRLWGYSKMFNGLLHLEAAFNSADTNFWIASEVINSVFDKNEFASFNSVGGTGFASVDHNNYLLANFALDSLGAPLEVGFMLPSVFALPDPAGYDLADEVFGKMVIGAKLNMDPVGIALQYTPGKAKNGAIYLGATFGLGDLNIGAAFEGYLGDDFVGYAGAGVGYGAGDFNVDAGFALGFDPGDLLIGANVAVSYKIIPDTLCLGLDAGFKMKGDANDFYVMPSLWYNVKGTGIATGYYSNDTALVLRYRFAKDAENALDITFKWSL